jgi:hypothetical protein
MNQSEALKRGSKVNASCNLLYNINKENGYKKKRDCDDQSKCKCKRSAGEIASLIRVSCVLIRGEMVSIVLQMLFGPFGKSF